MAEIFTLRKPQRIYSPTDRRSEPRDTEDRRRALQRRTLYHAIASALNQTKINDSLREFFALTMPAAIRHDGYLLRVFLEFVAEQLVQGIEGHSLTAQDLQQELIAGGVVLDEWGHEVRGGTYINIVGERMSVITLLSETDKEQKRIGQLEQALAFANAKVVEPVENRRLLINFLQQSMDVAEAKAFTFNVIEKTWQQPPMVRGEEIDRFKTAQVPAEGTEEALLSGLLALSRAQIHSSNGNGEYEFYRASRGGWGFLLMPRTARESFANVWEKERDVFSLFIRRGQEVIDIFSMVKEAGREFFRDHGEREDQIALLRNIVPSFREKMEMTEMVQALREASEKDPLTGLWNKRPFEKAFLREAALVRRYRCPLSLAIIDIDHFKRVNDTYGHGAGDKVLKELARILETAIRETDYLCSRDGGEEFAVLLPKTNREGALTFAERLRRLVERNVFAVIDNEGEPHNINITLSIGVVTLDQKEIELENVKGAADRALYEAKEGGRNRVVIGQLN
jgi:diguanylate cyclase (GGDEF)-like protein